MTDSSRCEGHVGSVLRAVDGAAPTVRESAYVPPEATPIGDVTLEDRASVWPGVVLRGDEAPITVREGSYVQDNAVCHDRVSIGPYATVGHAVVLHSCTGGERAMVGMNAVVLDGSSIGERAIVAAGSVVTEHTRVAPHSMVAGTPAAVVREDIGETDWGVAADRYIERAERYRESARPAED